MVSVTTEAGTPVDGLNKDHFSLAEGGRTVSISSVATDTLPKAICLVVDTSAGMSGDLASVQGALPAFLNALKPTDLAMLIAAGDSSSVVEKFTPDKKKVRESLKTLKTQGSTKLYEPLSTAITAFNIRGAEKVVLLVTNGKEVVQNKEDLALSHTPRSIAQLARDRQVPLWIVGLGAGIDGAILLKLARATGGFAVLVPSADGLPQAMNRLTEMSAKMYRLTYRIERPNDKSQRTLSLTVGRGGQTGTGRGRFAAVPTARPANDNSFVREEVPDDLPPSRFEGPDQNPYQ